MLHVRSFGEVAAVCHNARLEATRLQENDDYLELLKKTLTGFLFDESAWQVKERIVLDGRQLTLPPEVCVVHRVPFDVERRTNGRDWPFVGYTMVGLKRLDNIQRCIETIVETNVPGDLMETGVWRGGAGIFMRAVLKRLGAGDRKVWLADSFDGMPAPTPTDLALDAHADHTADRQLAVSLEQVQANFRRFDLLDEQVGFIKGWFADTLPNAPVVKLALLRLDGDLYESTRVALESLYPRVSPGGFVIVDDFGDWAGCRKAVEDYRAKHGIAAEIQPIDGFGVFWQVPQAA